MCLIVSAEEVNFNSKDWVYWLYLSVATFVICAVLVGCFSLSYVSVAKTFMAIISFLGRRFLLFRAEMLLSNMEFVLSVRLYETTGRIGSVWNICRLSRLENSAQGRGVVTVWFLILCEVEGVGMRLSVIDSSPLPIQNFQTWTHHREISHFSHFYSHTSSNTNIGCRVTSSPVPYWLELWITHYTTLLTTLK